MVIGLGRFGSSLATTLIERGHTVLGIDNTFELVQRHSGELTQTLQLDSTDEAALREADIASYPTVIVAIGSDLEASLLTVLALKALGIENVVCKATSLTHRDILYKIGADRVVLPETEAGRRLALDLSAPLILDQIQLDAQLRVSAIKTPMSMVGKTLGEVDLPGRYRLNVLAIHGKGGLKEAPKADYRLQPSDVLVVASTEPDVVRFCGA